MSVSHAPDTSATGTDEREAGKIPGLPEVLALVPDPRKRRGRRFRLVFILAVAVACALAGAGNFREAGDHAADLPQNVLARLGGRPHPLLQRITCLARKSRLSQAGVISRRRGAPSASRRAAPTGL